MMTVMAIVCFAVFVLLVMISGFIPGHSNLSVFELERRKAAGDKLAAATLHREKLLVDIISLQRIKTAALLVLFVALAVVTFGWLIGVLLSVVVAVEYGAIARIPMVQRMSQKLYERYEPALLDAVEKLSGMMRFIRNVAPETSAPKKVDSREELDYLLANSAAVLSVDEKKLITHALQFEDRLVSEIMTPRGMIDSISTNELLGPLVLDDLHRTGHSRFPVTDGDIDHVVGMLHIQSLLTLDHRRSLTAGKTMEPRVFYIRQDQSLAHALTAFIRTHHHLFIVINEFRETVGIISLEDVIEALLGRKIIDEFDTHDDLRVVAQRNIRGNNAPKKRLDV
jgi:putative hemolysin